METVCLSFLLINSNLSKHGSSNPPTKAVLTVKGEAFIDLLTTAHERISQLPITVKSAQVFSWTSTFGIFPLNSLSCLSVLRASGIFVLSLSMVRVSPFPVHLALVRGLHDLHGFHSGATFVSLTSSLSSSASGPSPSTVTSLSREWVFQDIQFHLWTSYGLNSEVPHSRDVQEQGSC